VALVFLHQPVRFLPSSPLRQPRPSCSPRHGLLPLAIETDFSLNSFPSSSPSRPFGAITVAAIVLILGPQPAPPMLESVAVYTEGKFRRWTFGRWQPARQSLWFRLFALDYLGCVFDSHHITLQLD
jgi:hypothetical protein